MKLGGLSRYDLVAVLSQSFDCIISALEKIMDNGDDASAKADALHTYLCKLKLFIFTIVIMKTMLSLTFITYKYLQTESINLSSAIRKIELVKMAFVDLRKNGEEFYKLNTPKYFNLMLN